jgi:hypothetical protein
MQDRLFVAVVGEPRSGKSTTWNELFGRRVKTGERPHVLSVTQADRIKARFVSDSNKLGPLSVEVFLISGSNEERKQYAEKVLRRVDCRIVLCSVQYVEEAFARTWNYVFEQEFCIYAQWINPGHGGHENWDRLGLMNRLLAQRAVISVRDGRENQARLKKRVGEIRQYIHGWAAARGLLKL